MREWRRPSRTGRPLKRSAVLLCADEARKWNGFPPPQPGHGSCRREAKAPAGRRKTKAHDHEQTKHEIKKRMRSGLMLIAGGRANCVGSDESTGPWRQGRLGECWGVVTFPGVVTSSASERAVESDRQTQTMTPETRSFMSPCFHGRARVGGSDAQPFRPRPRISPIRCRTFSNASGWCDQCR